MTDEIPASIAAREVYLAALRRNEARLPDMAGVEALAIQLGIVDRLRRAVIAEAGYNLRDTGPGSEVRA